MRCHSDDYPEKIENLHVYFKEQKVTFSYCAPKMPHLMSGPEGKSFKSGHDS